MTKYVWTNGKGKRVSTDGDRPSEPGDWWPAWAKSRVHGDRYTPYDGHTSWHRMANSLMAQAARDNFQRKQSR